MTSSQENPCVPSVRSSVQDQIKKLLQNLCDDIQMDQCLCSLVHFWGEDTGIQKVLKEIISIFATFVPPLKNRFIQFIQIHLARTVLNFNDVLFKLFFLCSSGIFEL